MTVNINSVPFFAVGVALLTCCAIGLVYAIHRFSRTDWLVCIFGITGFSTLLLGAARVFGGDGCHSGLCGIPILQHTEPLYPYFPAALIVIAITLNIYGNRKNQKA